MFIFTAEHVISTELATNEANVEIQMQSVTFETRIITINYYIYIYIYIYIIDNYIYIYIQELANRYWIKSTFAYARN